MKRKSYWLFAGLLILSMILAACGEADTGGNPGGNAGGNTSGNTGGEETGGEEGGSGEMASELVTLTIGFTKSVTGRYETSSGRQFKGFDLWLADVNSAGGITLSDGTVVTFETVWYDDESNGDRVQELYTRLVTDDEADLLISPYSSGLTKSAAVIAEQYGRVMIATGAASDSIFQQGYTQVYQIYTPASRYLVGAVDLLQSLDPAVDSVAIVYENEQFAIDVATQTQIYAESVGLNVVLFEGYDTETTDFGPFINKIEESGATVVMGGGHFQDGSTFARQVYERGADVDFFAMVVAPPEPDFAELGEAALGVIGPSHWEPAANITQAASEGFAWLGPDGDEFVAAYTAEYDEDPSYHSAGGYAAGLVLQYAIEMADSTDSADIRAALEEMDLMTFWGRVMFDTTAENHGLQIGHSSMYVQWQYDEEGNLLKQVVWPLEGSTAEALYPIR
jgi:branched-chain amino acid transport system substrate-binding protein